MTPTGKAFVLSRLSDAPDLASLRKVWGNIGREYASDPEIIALKDRLKAQFERESAA